MNVWNFFRGSPKIVTFPKYTDRLSLSRHFSGAREWRVGVANNFIVMTLVSSQRGGGNVS